MRRFPRNVSERHALLVELRVYFVRDDRIDDHAEDELHGLDDRLGRSLATSAHGELNYRGEHRWARIAPVDTGGKQRNGRALWRRGGRDRCCGGGSLAGPRSEAQNTDSLTGIAQPQQISRTACGQADAVSQYRQSSHSHT